MLGIGEGPKALKKGEQTLSLKERKYTGQVCFYAAFLLSVSFSLHGIGWLEPRQETTVLLA